MYNSDDSNLSHFFQIFGVLSVVSLVYFLIVSMLKKHTENAISGHLDWLKSQIFQRWRSRLTWNHFFLVYFLIISMLKKHAGNAISGHLDGLKSQIFHRWRSRLTWIHFSGILLSFWTFDFSRRRSYVIAPVS